MDSSQREKITFLIFSSSGYTKTSFATYEKYFMQVGHATVFWVEYWVHKTICPSLSVCEHKLTWKNYTVYIIMLKISKQNLYFRYTRYSFKKIKREIFLTSVKPNYQLSG